ncbi:MAG: aromatic-ring-hydroxylating dioxygenase subunit beta [Firmicutes bacterium]|nr:aromatic-ring-hydroxylating dioxygenase subunit beta [Bacillota bacterium]
MPELPMTVAEASAFLFLEARLLDERRFEEWLDLFTNDAVYWVPGHDPDDPAATSIIYDDRPTMEDRVRRLRSPVTFAQSPPSRTLHLIGNVEVEARSPREVRIDSVCVIHETRLGQTRAFAARCEHHLRREGEAGWRISLKKVVLLDRDAPLYNLTFLL